MAAHPKAVKVAKEAVDDFIGVFARQLKSIIQTEMFPVIKAEFMQAYDRLTEQELSEMGSAVEGPDSTNLVRYRPVFEGMIDRDLANVGFSGTAIAMHVGPGSSAPGYEMGSADVSLSTNSVDFLGYYMAGVAAEVAYLTHEQFWGAAEAGSFSPKAGQYTRFGDGYLLSKSNYSKSGMEAFLGLPFSSVRHSISGQRRYTGFNKIVKNLDLNSYISKAVTATTTIIQNKYK